MDAGQRKTIDDTVDDPTAELMPISFVYVIGAYFAASCMVVSFRISSSFNPPGLVHLDGIAYFFAEQGAADGRSGRDLTVSGIGLFGGHQFVGDLFLASWCRAPPPRSPSRRGHAEF